jgi:CHAT domain-containing protein
MRFLRPLIFTFLLAAALTCSAWPATAQPTNSDNQNSDTVAELRAAITKQEKEIAAAENADSRLALSKKLANLEIQLGDACGALKQYAEAGEWYARADEVREKNYQIEKTRVEEQIANLERLSKSKREDATLSESDRANFIKTYRSIIDGLLNVLASQASERRDFVTQTAIAERRLVLARETNDPSTIATALDALAEAKRKSGDLIEARATAEQALEFRRKDPRRKFIYDTVRLLAWIADDANDWREAETRYRELMEMAKPGALPPLFDLDDEKDAGLRRAKARMNVEDRLNQVQTALSARLYLADILERKGNYGEADRESKSIAGEISKLYAIGADDESELLTLIAAHEKPQRDVIERLGLQITVADINAHRLSKGAPTTDEEISRLKTADLFAKSLRAQLAVKYAALLADEGDLDNAAQAYRAAIAFFQNVLGGTFPAVGLYSALGRTERQRGDFEAAEAALNTALAIYQRQQDASGIASVLAEQSALRVDQNRVAEARAAAEDSLKIGRTLGNRVQIAGLLRALGRAESEAGGDQLKLSEQHLREALATWRDLGLRAHTAYTLSSLGLTLERQGRINDALAAYEEAVKLIELLTTSISSDVGSGVFNSSTGNRELYDRLIRLLLKLGRTTEALGYLERAKSKALDDALAGAKVKTSNPALNLLLGRVQDLGDSLRVSETTATAELSSPKRDPQKVARARSQLADTQQRYLQAVAAIETANPFFASLVAVNPTNLIEVRRRLPLNTALIEYFPSDKELYIFVITPGKPPMVRRSSIDREQLATLVAQYRQAIKVIEDPYSGGAEAIQTARRNTFWRDDGTEVFKKYVAPIKTLTDKLYRALITPIEPDIEKSDTWLLVPAGELYYLPIHALGRVKPNGDLEFLIERKRLAYMSSADLLNVVTSVKQSNGRMTKALRPILALGNPDPKYNPLESAAEEVEALRQLFPTADIYKENEATLAHVKEAAGRVRYLHFATHGILDLKDPKESYLLLAGEPNQLTVKAIVENTYGLSFAGTELATLSACETNLGGFDPGATYSSLSRAFAKAGAPTVVASLWEVDDDSTRDTMAAFYKELAAGQPKGEALRRAQVAVMHNPKFAHPYFWSAFVLMGDWR